MKSHVVTVSFEMAGESRLAFCEKPARHQWKVNAKISIMHAESEYPYYVYKTINKA